MRTITHWIGGKPSTGSASRTSPVLNPATGAQQAEVVLASAADVDEAVQTAARAFDVLVADLAEQAHGDLVRIPRTRS